MTNMEIIILLLMHIGIFLHEVGHYIVAKKQGIYLGWGLIPTPHIKLKEIFESRWNYLGGILFSLIVIYPLHLAGLIWWKGLILMMTLGFLDIIVFLFYNKIKRDSQKG